jgi:hypothetical protein
MKVQPISSEEANAGGFGEPFPAGEYDFLIYAAEETTSKAGNDMLKLTLHIFNKRGEKQTTFDYILSSQTGAWKARHLMEAIGMVREYDRGEIDPIKIEGKPGRCKLQLVPAKDQFPAKNAVADYLGPKQAESAISYGPANTRARPPEPAQATGGRIIEDEIPF